MRHTAAAVVLALSVVLAACSDTPADKGISPDIAGPMMAKKGGGTACSSTQAALVEADQDVLFAGATLNTARALWRNVKQDCSTSNATRMASAQDALMEYIRFTIVLYRDNPSEILPDDNSAAIAGHWNLAFPYVDYVAPGLPNNVLDLGAARVVSRTELVDADSVEFGIPSVAAMQIEEQVSGGDPRGHLFVIYPEPGNCNPQTALAESPDCFNFKAFPSALPGAFNPRVKVGICAEVSFVAPGFAHYSGTGTTTIEPPIDYPGHAFCDGEEPVRRYGVFGRVTRLASKIFGVKRAYAAHGGLGTLAPGFSTFVPVERNLFKATFTHDALGFAPDSGEIHPPDRGYWLKVFSTSPGSIEVQPSLGDLNTQPVVLNQGGGACQNNCGGLDLWGQIETADNSRAIAGRVLVSWTSVQDHAAPKEAPFVLRSSADVEIARVAYVKAQGGTRIKFNNQVVPGADWVKGQRQSFSILLNFVTGDATLTVRNSAGTVVATVTQNIRNGATDLSQVNAEFSNIDSGIVGWDNIIVERLPDSE